jgi:hypothetical protein
MLTFNKRYFALTILLFVVEVLIALFVRDRFVRPYVGDVLVVMLIYCFVKTFMNLPITSVAIFVLVFAFTIEFFQYIHIVERWGLEKSALARTVIGTSFAWADIVAYIAGFVLIVVTETYREKNAGSIFC